MRSVSGPPKYLVVDDHAAFRQTVKDFLPGKQVEVIECDDGAEVVAYDKHKPDWTVMDIQMPGMDGLKAPVSSVLKIRRPASSFSASMIPLTCAKRRARRAPLLMSGRTG